MSHFSSPLSTHSVTLKPWQIGKRQPQLGTHDNAPHSKETKILQIHGTDLSVSAIPALLAARRSPLAVIAMLLPLMIIACHFARWPFVVGMRQQMTGNRKTKPKRPEQGKDKEHRTVFRRKGDNRNLKIAAHFVCRSGIVDAGNYISAGD